MVQLCDRAILLDRGEVLLDGKPKIVVNQYQRFLNLSGASAETAREQIRAMDGWTAPAGKEREEGGGDEAAAGDGGDTAAAAESAPQASDESWFDPNLKSDSRVEYESRGARIRDIRITTLDGRAVNVLTLGHSYIYEYLVDIERDAEDFVCGMAIRTVQGVDLGGTATHLTGDRIAHVSAGQTLRVRFRFDCIARPGVYFLNCGVGSLKDGEAALHRILDAICFRVAESDTLNFTNLVDFSISPTIDIAD